MSEIDRVVAVAAEHQANIDEQRKQESLARERMVRVGNVWYRACRFELPCCRSEEQIAYCRALWMWALAKRLIQAGYGKWLKSQQDKAVAAVENFDRKQFSSIEGQQNGLCAAEHRKLVTTLLLNADKENVHDMAAEVRNLSDEETRHYLKQLWDEWSRDFRPKSSSVSSPMPAAGTSRPAGELPERPQSSESGMPELVRTGSDLLALPKPRGMTFAPWLGSPSDDGGPSYGECPDAG